MTATRDVPAETLAMIGYPRRFPRRRLVNDRSIALAGARRRKAQSIAGFVPSSGQLSDQLSAVRTNANFGRERSQSYDGARLAVPAVMQLDMIERHAAVTSARFALETINDATSTWPPSVAADAKRAASAVMATAAQALDADTPAACRKLLRDAVVNAVMLTSICDIAFAHGLGNDRLEQTLRHTTQTLSMLGLCFRATTAARE